MSVRKIQFTNNEIYHLFNQGIDKRNIIEDREDADRFILSMKYFNQVKPIGSIYEYSYRLRSHNKRKILPQQEPLVTFISYCLNPNHFHFLLRQERENGISEFMHRLGGYMYYFNQKYRRRGALFQGKFKAVHVNNDEKFNHLMVYVNLNDRVHNLRGKASKIVRSSEQEYSGRENGSGMCDLSYRDSYFGNGANYNDFAQQWLPMIQDMKADDIYNF